MDQRLKVHVDMARSTHEMVAQADAYMRAGGHPLAELNAPLERERREAGEALIRKDTPHALSCVARFWMICEGNAEAVEANRTMTQLLREATNAWAAQFDRSDDIDPSVPGADLVDWFAEWRRRAKAVIAQIGEGESCR
jgi:hypothetical protein